MNQTTQNPIQLKSDWKSSLTDNGYILLTGMDVVNTRSILTELECIIHENLVKAALDSRSL